MLALERPDRIHVAFDDSYLVANAGLLLPVTLVGATFGNEHFNNLYTSHHSIC